MAAAQSFRFIYEPDDALKCMICLEVAEDPRQHEKCGKLFCKECLDEYGKVKPCPNCRAKQPQYFEDTRGKDLAANSKLKLRPNSRTTRVM